MPVSSTVTFDMKMFNTAGVLLIAVLLAAGAIQIGELSKTTVGEADIHLHNYNTVNGVIGDESFIATFGQEPGPGDSEDLRLRTHLAYVENLLRSRPVGDLSQELREARAHNLDRLHDYWTAGVFPRNRVVPDHRNPVFIDEAGRICAVGYLFEQDLGREEAERINARYKTSTVFEIDDPALGAWLAKSGLTQTEAAMIQPFYGPYLEYLFEFSTDGTTACGTNENPEATVPFSDGVTISDMMRMPGLVCEDGTDDVFESSGFLAEFDPIRSIRYMLDYDGSTERPLDLFVMFNTWRSSTGPTEGRIVVSTDGGSTFEVAHSFAISTAPTSEISFFSFSGAPPGSDVLVAFEAHGGDPFGSFFLDDVTGFMGYTPVEFLSFDATVDRGDVSLRWVTASETNNAGFEVQMRSADERDFSTLGFVEGHGTTTEVRNYMYSVRDLDPSAYAFRLKQIDFDGAFEYSDEIEVVVAVPGTHLLTNVYPNPFNPLAQFSLSVAQTQNVNVSVFDALGRKVLNLFDGVLDGGRAHPFALDGRGLATGLLLIRATGETFAASQSVILLR